MRVNNKVITASNQRQRSRWPRLITVNPNRALKEPALLAAPIGTIYDLKFRLTQSILERFKDIEDQPKKITRGSRTLKYVK